MILISIFQLINPILLMVHLITSMYHEPSQGFYGIRTYYRKQYMNGMPWYASAIVMAPRLPLGGIHPLHYNWCLVVLLYASVCVSNHCPAPPCHCNHGNTVVLCPHSQLMIIPVLPSSTLDLQLSYNRIRLLYNHSLYAAPRTRYLDLRHNDLIQIHAGAFKILRDLHTLLLSHNQLTYLAPGMFISNAHLHTLDLHHNAITDLSDNVLTPLHSLAVLNVSMNRLVTPRLGPGLEHTHAMTSVDWSYNHMHTLDRQLFMVTSYWSRDIPTSFNLSYCSIEEIRPGAFKGLRHVETFSLSGGFISTVPMQDLIFEP